jgi:hypothetical protein
MKKTVLIDDALLKGANEAVGAATDNETIRLGLGDRGAGVAY